MWIASPFLMAQGVRESSSIVKMAAAAVVVAGLSFGAPILVPIALSILVSFAVAPLVTRLERWHFGRHGSVMTVVLLGCTLVAGTLFLVAGQAADLLARLPAYRGNLSSKFEVVRSLDRKWASARGELARASQDPESAAKEESDRAAIKPGGPTPAASPEPRDFTSLREGISKSIQWVLTAGGVVVLVIFILLQRQDLHARALRVAGGGHHGVTSQALNEAADTLSRYLLAELALNTLYGAIVTLGLFFLGIPNPFIWGLLCALLRFVPYVGPIFAAALPIGMSLAISAGWGVPLATVGFFLGLELVVNNFVEPLVHGRSTGLSPVAILAAAAFWTWLWGPVGLILSTPLTVCLFVFGKHFPPLHFFHVLMGQEVDKSLAARLYSRLVAADHDAAWEVVAGELKHSELGETFDATLVPALELVKRNRLAGDLDLEESRRMIRDIEEIAEEAADEVRAGSAAQTVTKGDVVCVATKDETDEVSCHLLSRVLEREGITTRTCMPEATAAPDFRKPAVLCVLDVRTSSSRRLESLADRLRRRFPDVPIVAARLPVNRTAEAPATPGAPAHLAPSTLEECREVVKRLLTPGNAPVATPPPAEVAVPVAG